MDLASLLAAGGATRAQVKKVREALAADLSNMGGSVWSPLSLFKGGESGDFWEVSPYLADIDKTASTWPGIVGNHNLVQATLANRPTLRQRADGKLRMHFPANTSMGVSGSSGLFNYLHDGTGGTVVMMVEWLPSSAADALLRTAGASTQNGIQIGKGTTNQAVGASICRGVSGQLAANVSNAILPVCTGRLSMIKVAYKNNGTSTDLQVGIDACRNIASVVTTLANQPASGNAGQSLTIGGTGEFYVYGIVVINRVTTKSEDRQVFEYFNSKYRHDDQKTNYIIGDMSQSNMSGRGAFSANVPTPMVGCYIYTKAGRYELTSEPSHTINDVLIQTNPAEPGFTTPAVSSVLTTQRAIMVDYGEATMWVVNAVGSTGFTDWDTPSTVDDQTTLFGATIQRMLKVKRERGGAFVLMMTGHEGSASLAVPDYINGGVGAAYQTAMTNFINHVRSALGENAPVIFAQLAPTDDLTESVNHAAGAEAQRQCELSITGAYMVPMHDVKRNASADDIHWSADGLYIAGARYALCFGEHILGRAVNGTGPRISSWWKASSTRIVLRCDKPINTTAGSYGNLFRVYDNGSEVTVSSAGRDGTTLTDINIDLAAPLSANPVTFTYGYRAGLASAARTDFVADSDGWPLPVFGPLLVPAA